MKITSSKTRLMRILVLVVVIAGASVAVLVQQRSRPNLQDVSTAAPVIAANDSIWLASDTSTYQFTLPSELEVFANESNLYQAQGLWKANEAHQFLLEIVPENQDSEYLAGESESIASGGLTIAMNSELSSKVISADSYDRFRVIARVTPAVSETETMVVSASLTAPQGELSAQMSEDVLSTMRTFLSSFQHSTPQ